MRFVKKCVKTSPICISVPMYEVFARTRSQLAVIGRPVVGQQALAVIRRFRALAFVQPRQIAVSQPVIHEIETAAVARSHLRLQDIAIAFLVENR